jgi:hypothetical protein
MIYEITLVFDDFDPHAEQPLLTLEEVMLYAENLGRDLFSFKHLPGYEGFRVEAREGGITVEGMKALTQP